jgi:hypothetical protein
MRWFEYIQRRSVEAPIRNEVIRRIDNDKRSRERPNMIWEEFVKRDLKEWYITKELSLDRKEWKVVIHMSEP